MNLDPFLPAGHDPAGVVLSMVIALLASWVALDLGQRMRQAEARMAWGWCIGGAVAMGTGIWSMHFIGMLALRLPIDVGYDHGLTFASWLVATLVSGLALRIGSGQQLGPRRLAGGALLMGAGICGMHYLGMAAMVLAPGVVWHRPLVLLSVAIAVTASAVALLIFFGLRRLVGRQALYGKAGSALVMGLAISGMHYTGMAAAQFPADTVCLSAQSLRGEGLGLVIAFGSTSMLLLAVLTGVLDSHLQSRSTRLAHSLQQANAALQAQALLDPLTGLPNRQAVDRRLAAADVGHELALLYIDLDGFKPVNDMHGHTVGDQLLQQLGQRLRAVGAPGSLPARIGGDEFVLIIDGPNDHNRLLGLARGLIDRLAQPCVVQGISVSVGASVGMALYPEDGALPGLMACADAAMLDAKRAGGSAAVFYDAAMDQHSKARQALLHALRLTLPQQQFELHYQPKLQVASGQVTSVEALIRWRHPVQGMVSPARFIPLAEQHGQIVAIGQWVLEQACEQARQWQRQGLTLRVAVNLSPHQLREANFVDTLLATLTRHGLAPQALTCEVTETVVMEETPAMQRAIERLGQAGMHISIDDFGTGYSSLAYLRRLPAKELKVDRCFVADLETSADARAIVDSVLRLAHALGKTVVAEGVETEAQRRFLVENGCDELQGYLLARPMPAARLLDWVLAHRGQRSAQIPPPDLAENRAMQPA